MQNLETVARVHTHTHTQGNLINKKETSIKNALLNIQIKRWVKYLPVFFAFKNKTVINVLRC